jgi:hypothetical protein
LVVNHETNGGARRWSPWRRRWTCGDDQALAWKRRKRKTKFYRLKAKLKNRIFVLPVKMQ